MSEKVNHPAHYNSGKYEVIDILEDQLTSEEFNGFLKGNVIKYIMREKHKGGIEDVKKAQWYINKFIEVHEKSEDLDSEIEKLAKEIRENTGPEEEAVSRMLEMIKKELVRNK